jgi:AmmeMemoRadiSam system protein B
MSHVRPSAVAGLFYPGQALALRAQVADLLAHAGARTVPARPPRILVVPHAGYVYSGPVAAPAYRLLHGYRSTIRRIVLLGPTHRVAVRGAAIPSASAFATPLGDVPLDRDAMRQLARLPFVVENDAAHAAEHSLEVQLPFLQTVLGQFTLVPVAVGSVAPAELALLFDTLWGGDETVFLVSSDLSTVDRILALDPVIDHAQACGATPLNAALLAARRAGLEASLLDLRNSGDTAGDHSRVVGYCAISFHGPSDEPH